MQYLFIDGFRGFKNTCIPITDITFLVGENSTGKTSVLTLLKLLSSQRFWNRQEFEADEAGFIHFSDIVGETKKTRRTFRVGVISTAKDDDVFGPKIEMGDWKFVGQMLTFVERAGMPVLSGYTFNVDNQLIDFRFQGGATKFSVETILKPRSFENFTELFSTWGFARSHLSRYRHFKPRYFKSVREGRAVPIPWLLVDVEDQLKKEGIKIGYDFAFGSSELVWLAPIRSKPRRTYDEYKVEFSSEGLHTPYIIKKLLQTRSEAARFRGFMEKFGKDSGMFESVTIKRHGRELTAPFELDVVLNSRAFGISSVGYGVSQSLPIIVEMFSRSKGSWFGIQQPEVHLHPRAQAALGDLLYEVATHEGKKFVIETHSDYIIDRYRSNLKKNKENQSSQVLFFERTKDGNKCTAIPISDDGQLSDDQPEKYRAFFVKEAIKTLAL